jgi:hypothetical protein
MLSIHSEAIESKVACYHEFLVRYSMHSKVVYGFVEGKTDPCFYRGFIDSLLPEGWSIELWPAGNKGQVYRIYSDLDWRRFQKKRVCFFVDRDLSAIIPEKLVSDSNIYITDGYSIENDLVTKNTCHRVLTELCGFSNTNHGDLDRVCTLFTQELECFMKAMIPIMAWILTWRRNRKTPNLNDIKMSDLFFIQNGRLQMVTSPKGKASVVEYLHEQSNIEMNATDNILQSQKEFKKKRIYKKFIRGKYLFWFLIEFCYTVHRDAAKLFGGITKSPKINVTLSVSNGVAVIGARGRMPTSLRKFLKSTFCDYIKIQRQRRLSSKKRNVQHPRAGPYHHHERF